MLGVFSIEHANEERLRLGVTLFIVLQAFKLQVTTAVPRVVVMTHIDKYMSSAFLFCFAVYVYTSVAVFLGENMTKEMDHQIFFSFVIVFIFLQLCFSALAVKHKVA